MNKIALPIYHILSSIKQTHTFQAIAIDFPFRSEPHSHTQAAVDEWNGVTNIIPHHANVLWATPAAPSAFPIFHSMATPSPAILLITSTSEPNRLSFGWRNSFIVLHVVFAVSWAEQYSSDAVAIWLHAWKWNTIICAFDVDLHRNVWMTMEKIGNI